MLLDKDLKKLFKNDYSGIDIISKNVFKVTNYGTIDLVDKNENKIINKKGKKAIILRDYDNSNITSVYSGQISKNFVNTTTDGDIMTLINFSANEEGLPDLYFMSIR